MVKSNPRLALVCLLVGLEENASTGGRNTLLGRWEEEKVTGDVLLLMARSPLFWCIQVMWSHNLLLDSVWLSGSGV